MKKNASKTLLNKFLLGIILISIALNSCKKNSDLDLIKVDKNLIKEVVSLSTTKQRRLAFIGLSADEKFYLIQQQLEYVLENIPLNTIQKNLIAEMKNNMPNNVYQDEQARLSFKQRWRDEWQQRSLDLLGRDFITTYFTQIINTNSKENPSQNLREAEPPAPTGCTCNNIDDWCTGSTTSCTKGNCVSDSWGCGTYMLEECNGLCRGRILEH